MTTHKVERTEEEMAASAEKLKAEAQKALAEARKANLEADNAELEGKSQRIFVEKQELEAKLWHEKHAARLNDDDHQRVYRFLESVTSSSVKDAISTLVRWSRTDPGCPITIIFDSPGGSIIDGFHLFDVIIELRRKGHEITTVAQGMAASMAGVLLQAGDIRVMSEQAALLIHEASFGAMGSYGKVEDQVEFVKKLQKRILKIFANRSNMSEEEIENKWHRKDWWMLADEALELGFCDEVRGLAATA